MHLGPLSEDYLDIPEDLLDRVSSWLQSLNLDYWRISFGAVELREGVVENLERCYTSISATRGVGVLLVYEGKVGFASTNYLSEESLKRTIRKCLKLSRIAGKAKFSPPESPCTDFPRPPSVKAPIDDLDELLELAEEARKLAKASDMNLRNASGTFGFFKYYKRIIDSLGFDGSYCYPVYQAIFSVVAKKGDELYEGFESISLISGAEAVKRFGPTELFDKALHDLKVKLSAKSFKVQKIRILADPEFSGTIAHESLGHLVEADSVLDGLSCLTGKLGEKIGSEIISVVDTGEYIGDGIWLPFDDEGVPAERVTIVQNGVLKSYLHSLETASEMNVSPTGNARASSPMVYPLVRMRNTFFLPSDFSIDELLEDLKRGLLIKGSTGGEAKDDGTFIFSAKEAFYVENGEVKWPVRSASVRGQIANFLKNVKAASKEFEVKIGFCEKEGQSVLVGLGGPYMLVDGVVVGST